MVSLGPTFPALGPVCVRCGLEGTAGRLTLWDPEGCARGTPGNPGRGRARSPTSGGGSSRAQVQKATEFAPPGWRARPGLGGPRELLGCAPSYSQALEHSGHHLTRFAAETFQRRARRPFKFPALGLPGSSSQSSGWGRKGGDKGVTGPAHSSGWGLVRGVLEAP